MSSSVHNTKRWLILGSILPIALSITWLGRSWWHEKLVLEELTRQGVHVYSSMGSTIVRVEFDKTSSQNQQQRIAQLIASAWSINQLNIIGTPAGDDFLECVGKSAHIRVIRLLPSQRSIAEVGASPPPLNAFPVLETLEQLDISFQTVTQNAARQIASNPRLDQLYLNGCTMREGSLSTLLSNSKLKTIYLSDCRFPRKELEVARQSSTATDVVVMDAKVTD